MKPANPKETTCCEHASRMIGSISDKWTMLIVRVLGERPCRFNALRREVGEISQKVLATTLRSLEENGFVSRTVTPTKPPQVEYALTDLGREFLEPVHALAGWVITNYPRIETARAAFRKRTEPESTGLDGSASRRHSPDQSRWT